MARKPTELRPIMTRLPEGLRRKLEKAAERTARSMNAEIIHRLEESFEPRPLDLFGLLAGALEDAQNKDRGQQLLALTGPLRSALQQLLPELHSVRIALLDDDGASMGTEANSYSDKGWKAHTKAAKGDKS